MRKGEGWEQAQNPLHPLAHAMGSAQHSSSNPALSISNSFLFIRRMLLRNHPPRSSHSWLEGFESCLSPCNPSEAPAKSLIDPSPLKPPGVKEPYKTHIVAGHFLVPYVNLCTSHRETHSIQTMTCAVFPELMPL